MGNALMDNWLELELAFYGMAESFENENSSGKSGLLEQKIGGYVGRKRIIENHLHNQLLAEVIR